MDAVKFLKEYTRMCDGYNCSKCPVEQELAEGRSCVSLEATNPEELVAIVEQWSKERPLVTNGMKVAELAGGRCNVGELPHLEGNWLRVWIDKDWWDAEYKGEETAKKCENCIYNPMNCEGA